MSDENQASIGLADLVAKVKQDLLSEISGKQQETPMLFDKAHILEWYKDLHPNEEF